MTALLDFAAHHVHTTWVGVSPSNSGPVRPHRIPIPTCASWDSCQPLRSNLLKRLRFGITPLRLRNARPGVYKNSEKKRERSQCSNIHIATIIAYAPPPFHPPVGYFQLRQLCTAQRKQGGTGRGQQRLQIGPLEEPNQ